MNKFNIDPRYEYEPNATRFGGPWSCIDDRTYDGAGSNMIGWGATPEAALHDLERLFEERDEFQQEVAADEDRQIREEISAAEELGEPPYFVKGN